MLKRRKKTLTKTPKKQQNYDFIINLCMEFLV